jgi:hypothetical protein
LEWDELNGTPIPATRSVVYQQIGDRLVRNYDGSSHPVVRRVVPGSAVFSVLNRAVTALYAVDAGLGASRTLSVTALMTPRPKA